MKTLLWIGFFAVVCLGAGMVVSCGDDDDDDSSDDDATDDDTTSDDDDTTSGDDDATDDTWTDSTSGLMWQDGANVGSDYFSWDDAVSYCETLSWGGFDDWRLPTISELRSLIRNCDGTESGGSCGIMDECLNTLCWNDPCVGCEYAEGPGVDGAYWPPELAGAVFWYWSTSTVEAADEHAWFVLFYNSYVDYGLKDFDLSFARCVR